MGSITNIHKVEPTVEPTAEKEEEGPSVMDEMMAAANAARKVVKDKAIAEEKRVKKEFGGGLKKGFFNSPPAQKNTTKTKKKTVRIFALSLSLPNQSIESNYLIPFYQLFLINLENYLAVLKYCLF
jgi:hypothetical protein